MSVDMFGRYQSQTTRQLQQIQSSKYPDTNKDLEANLRRLNQFVDYIAEYLQVMQKGVDQANEDAIQRMRDMATDMVVLLGGGQLLYGIDLGDLQYFLPALGAIFGFDSDKPFPISLIEMAEHFFLGYVVPLDSFVLEIQSIIDGWLVAMGIDQDFIDSVDELLTAINSVTGDVMGLFTDLWNVLETFGITTDGFGPFADLWHAITQLLGAYDLETLGDLADPILSALAPWVHEVAQFVNYLDQWIKAFSGGLTDVQGLLNFAGLFTPFTDFMTMAFDPITAWGDIITGALNPTGLLAGATASVEWIMSLFSGIPVSVIGDYVMNLLPNPDFSTPQSLTDGGGLFTWVDDIVHGIGGSATAMGDGTLKELFSDPVTPVKPGETIEGSHWLRWAGVTTSDATPAFTLGITYFRNDMTILTERTLATITSPAANSNNAAENNFVLLTHPADTVPANAAYAAQRLQQMPNVTAGQTWWSGGTFDKTQLLDANLLKQWQTLLDSLAASIPGLGTIAAIANRLNFLNPTGQFDASQLTNLINHPQLPNGIDIIPDLQQINDNLTNFLSGNSIVGTILTGTGMPDAASVMQNLYATLAANTRKVQALETQQTASTSGGRQVNINFGDYPDGPFPNVFNVTYTGPGSSRLAISGGKGVWSLVNNGDVDALMVYPTPMLTDFMIVRGTMSSPPENNSSGQKPRIWAIARGNSATNPTDYVFARGYCTGFLSFKGDIGCVKGGVETVWVSGVSLTWSLDMRLICGVGNNPRRHQVLSGDTIVVDLIEPAGGQSNYDVNHRYWGSKSETNGVNTPGAVAGCSVVDNAPPAVRGTTFRGSRRVGADVTIGTGGVRVPNNFYETVDWISPDLVYNPNDGCSVTVSKQGTYSVSWRALHGPFASAQGGHGLLWIKRAGGAWAPFARWVWGDDPFPAGFTLSNITLVDATTGHAEIALNPGDSIAPGFHFTSSMSNTGNAATMADGSQSWWSVVGVDTV